MANFPERLALSSNAGYMREGAEKYYHVNRMFLKIDDRPTWVSARLKALEGQNNMWVGEADSVFRGRAATCCLGFKTGLLFWGIRDEKPKQWQTSAVPNCLLSTSVGSGFTSWWWQSQSADYLLSRNHSICLVIKCMIFLNAVVNQAFVSHPTQSHVHCDAKKITIKPFNQLNMAALRRCPPVVAFIFEIL